MDKLRLVLKNVYVRHIKKTVINYNAESKALKVVNQVKKTPAPRHLSTHERVLKYIQEHPEIKDIVVEKPKQLIEWLKKVKVVSKTEPLPTIEPVSGIKPVIMKDSQPRPNPFGPAPEVKNVPPGRIALAQAVDLISECNHNQAAFKPQQLAKDLNLSEKDVCNLVKYYKPFELFVPPAWRDENYGEKGLRDIWKEHEHKYAMQAVVFSMQNLLAEERKEEKIDTRTKEEIIRDSEKLEAEEKRKLLEAEEKRQKELDDIKKLPHKRLRGKKDDQTGLISEK